MQNSDLSRPPLSPLARLKRPSLWAFILAFWILLILPWCKPEVTLNGLSSDFFGHGRLIYYFNNLRLKLGDRVFPDVLVGNEGWLYYTGQNSIDDFQGANLFSEADLQKYQQSFDSLYLQLGQKGILLLVVIVPDKNTIYPEFVPPQIARISSTTRLDQFIEYDRKYGKTPVIDLRPELLQAHQAELVFYKTNSHWNAVGEQIAYQQIINTLSQWIPGLAFHPTSDFKRVDAGSITHDIPRILGTPNIQEDYWSYEPLFASDVYVKVTPLPDGTSIRQASSLNLNLPAVLIYHDSFLDKIVPLLESQFGQTTSIPSTYVPGIWSLDWVDTTHPDIVIIEFAERFMNLNNLADFLR